MGSNIRKLNNYDLSGKYGIGYTSNTNEPFYFDLEDYDKIKGYTWFARHDKRKGRDYSKYYIESIIHLPTNTFFEGTNKRKFKTKRIHLHHLVLGIDDLNITEKILVDHKNQIPFDCKKENLHLADLRINNINKPRQSSNTSGIIGVEEHKGNIFISRICTSKNNRVVVYYGTNKEDAIISRLVNEYKYYGDNAPQKELFGQYGITKEFVEQYPERIILQLNNKSGITGVYEDPRRKNKKWKAYIYKNGKNICLGYFDKKEEAIVARLNAEKSCLRESKWQKHLWKEYGIDEQ